MIRRGLVVAVAAALSVFVVSTPAEAAGTVEVTVTGAGGAPAAGAVGTVACLAPATPVVTGWASGGPAPVQCSDGSTGVFTLIGSSTGSFGLAAGTWNVDIGLQNSPATHHELVVADGVTTSVVIELAEVTGQVLGDGGSRFQSSQLYVYSCPGGSPGVGCALADGGARGAVGMDGSYRLYVLPGSTDVAPAIGTPIAPVASLTGVVAGDEVTQNFTVTADDVATVSGMVNPDTPVWTNVTACLSPATIPCSDGVFVNVGPGEGYSFALGPGTWTLAGSAWYPTGIQTSAPVTLELAGGDVVAQDFSVPAPTLGTMSGSVTRADGSVPSDGGPLFGGYVLVCPSAVPVALDISCPGIQTVPVTGGAYSVQLVAGSYAVAALELFGQIPPPAASQAVVTIAGDGLLVCDFVIGGGAASCVAGAASVTPTEGDPGSSVEVSFPCSGLATVSFVDPGPPVSVLASDAASATGTAQFTLIVPSVPTGTVLEVTANCTASYSGYGGGGSVTFAPVMFTVTGTIDDGDGVEEPAGYDGNGDGIDDDQQADVTTVASATGTGLVTIVAPDDSYSLTDVTATEVTDPPPGVSSPIGAIGFTLHLPENVTEADVVLIVPDGLTVDGVIKTVGGVATDFTSHSTIDLENHRVVLHLSDGGPGDTSPAGDGLIVDPVVLQQGYGFAGFLSPIDADQVNNAKAGQTIPVKWQLTDAAGAPMGDPASFVKVTSNGGECNAEGGGDIDVYAPGGSGLQYNGDGEWQFNWKTDKAWAGQCRTLTLHLADHVGGRTAEFRFN